MTYDTDATPHPDAPPLAPSRGRIYIMISELNEQYLQLACGYAKPSSAHRSARAEMADLAAEMKRLQDIVQRMARE